MYVGAEDKDRAAIMDGIECDVKEVMRTLGVEFGFLGKVSLAEKRFLREMTFPIEAREIKYTA